eukprot:GILJ01007255.1.p1 GENE.GILJ01007255.1~~GILJ01007255.1.p1  ORF type:complete len:747 (+),score=120.01 GILJ01007255.1:41-2242(+)
MSSEQKENPSTILQKRSRHLLSPSPSRTPRLNNNSIDDGELEDKENVRMMVLESCNVSLEAPRQLRTALESLPVDIEVREHARPSPKRRLMEQPRTLVESISGADDFSSLPLPMATPFMSASGPEVLSLPHQVAMLDAALVRTNHNLEVLQQDLRLVLASEANVRRQHTALQSRYTAVKRCRNRDRLLFQRKCGERRSEITALKRQHIKLNERNSELQRENEELRQRLANMESKLIETDAIKCSVEQDLSQRVARVSQLENRIIRWEAEARLWRSTAVEAADNATASVTGETRIAWESLRPDLVRDLGSVPEKPSKLRALINICKSATQELANSKGDTTELELALREERLDKADLLDRYRTELAERRRLHNILQDLRGNVRVMCRIRPQFSGESENLTGPLRIVEGHQITVANGSGKRSLQFEYDSVFGPESSQDDVYQAVLPLITSVLDGYNGCIFAYGQTGSGKTYTMEGTKESPGINPRALKDLFATVSERQSSGEFEYELTVSMLEVYNETIYDLLATAATASTSSSTTLVGSLTPSKLDVRSSKSEGVHVPELTRLRVASAKEARRWLQFGYSQRSVGRTNMNEHSSRSHCLFSVQVSGHNKLLRQRTRSTLHLVDLAGSERLKRSEAEGDRLKETQHINKSLSSLGDVFASLASKQPHVPYRNSKLTFLLQEALGGDGKTLMVVQVSPEAQDLSETVSSLTFAARVARVEKGQATRRQVGPLSSAQS